MVIFYVPAAFDDVPYSVHVPLNLLAAGIVDTFVHRIDDAYVPHRSEAIAVDFVNVIVGCACDVLESHALALFAGDLETVDVFAVVVGAVVDRL